MDDATAHGYDPDFLRTPLPLPRPRDVSAEGNADQGFVELDYPRFTVVQNVARRFAAVTAVVIDGETLQDLPRRGSWRLDPRIPAEHQAGAAVYSANDLDRGHLVRRRDPGWGDAHDAQAATEATFFYTNAAPQVAGFNQSKQLWLGLEDHVLDYAQAYRHRIAVFTGPILDPDDPPYRGVLVPRRFWKIAAWSTGDSAISAAGFVLDQSDLLPAALGPTAVPPLGGFRTFQVPIGEIADATDLELGPLADADVLAPGAAIGASRWRPLTNAAEIVLG